MTKRQCLRHLNKSIAYEYQAGTMTEEMFWVYFLVTWVARITA